jgi:hypothetical protein
MGFNMVRPDFTPVWNKYLNKFILRGYEFGLTTNNQTGLFLTFDQPYNTDPDVANYFAYLDFLAAQCGQLGMHLMINGLNGNVADPVANADYLDFLQLLGDHFKTNINLGFYDILNEPAFQYDNTLSKSQACSLIASWYDALKAADPNHLITGGSTTLDETFHWDLGLMKLDFNQPHFYTNMFAYDNYDNTNQLNRIKGMLYWVNRNCPMPWMQGETGYRGADLPAWVTPDPAVGTSAQQETYIAATLKAARDYGSMGYVWWAYQDVSYPDPTDGFGLINIYKDVDPVTGTADDPDEKTASVAQFQNYLELFTHQPPAPDPTQAAKPPNYYDPYLHGTYSPNTNIITGHVQDDNGNPIEDAYIRGWTELYYDAQTNKSFYDIHYTFSDANGDFTLIPYDYDLLHFPNDNIINWYDVSAIGCELNGIPYWPTHTHTLKKVHFGYDNYISDKTISPSDYEKNLQGWSTLTTENITYQSGVTADVKARTEVHLLPPFDANNGSEVHIYTGETFADCDAFYNGNMRLSANGNVTTNNSIKENEIELQFAFPKEKFGFTVTPNPSNDKFTVTINESSNLQYQIVLTDVIGNIIKMEMMDNIFILDASKMPKGIYYLTINSKTQKIILL